MWCFQPSMDVPNAVLGQLFDPACVASGTVALREIAYVAQNGKKTQKKTARGPSSKIAALWLEAPHTNKVQKL